MLVAVLAVMKAGSPYVPLDPSYPADRIALMLEDSQAPIVVASADRSDQFDGDGSKIVALDLNDSETLSSDSSPLDNLPAPDDLAYVIYTSGSTGRPKGVALPHRALNNLVSWQLAQPDFVSGAKVLQFASLSFDVSFQEIATTLASGGTLYLIDEDLRRDPGRLIRLIDEQRIQRIFLPFVALRQLAETAHEAGLFPHSLREVYTAGEQLFVTANVRGFFKCLGGAILGNHYGPSETHVVTSLILSGDPDEWPDAPSIGCTITNVTAEVLDENLKPVADGEQGELFIAGDCLARGYLHRPDLTKERFLSVPGLDGGPVRAYRSGDLVVREPGGEIFFKGRTDHQVKIRGHRVEPGEVAAALSGLETVAQCHVVAHEFQAGMKSLVAYIKASGDEELNIESVRSLAKSVLPYYMVPSVFVTVEDFPLTPSGKVDVKALPKPDPATLTANTCVAPETESERRLSVIWQAVLNVEKLGVTSDFFEMGGHSLLVGSMFEKIRKEFGADLPFASLVKASTIREMAKLLDAEPQQGQAGWNSLVCMQPEGSRIPVFMIHGGYGNVLSFSMVSRGLGDDQPFYGLQWGGLNGGRGQLTTDEMVEDYLREIRTVCPEGPFVLGGLCAGGLIAYEMARRLRESGEDVPLVVMYDSPNIWTEAHGKEDEPMEPSPGYFEQVIASVKAHVIGMRDSQDDRRGLSLGERIRFSKTLASRLIGDFLIWLRPEHSFVTLFGPAWCWIARVAGVAVPPMYRELHTIDAIRRAIRAHRFEPCDVDVLYVISDSHPPRNLALFGHWKDELMGWTPLLHERFEVARVDGASHDTIPYHPGSIKALAKRLDQLRMRPAER